MKTTSEKRFTRTAVAASIAAMGLCALPALAAGDEVAALIRPDSQIEIGAGYVSDGSFKFGDYNGMYKDGAHLIGAVEINRRNEANNQYFTLTGRNLGLGSRNLILTVGEQGNYGVSLEYDEILRLYSDSYQTPYLGAGTAVLTQPATVVDGAAVSTITGLAAAMKPYAVKTERKAFGVGLTKELVQGWDIETNAKRETKDGSRQVAAMIQSGTGGSRTVVIVPEPVDYTTDQIEAIARYTSQKLQFQFGYYGSFFKNDNKSLTWDNLFTGTGNTKGSYGLPPDNEFHQLNASGRYVVSKLTSITGSLSLGQMTQNDLFLPYSTATGTLPVGLTYPVLPTASLNGKVNTTNASLKLNTTLMPKLKLTAGLRYDDRDNKTPINLYNYINGDRDAGFSSGVSATWRSNMPLDITKTSAYADFDYHLSSATKLIFGYDFHKVSHNYEPTTGDTEHTLKAGVKHRFGEIASGSASYAYSDRKASAYDGAAPLYSTYTQAYLSSLVGASGKTSPWLEVPTLRKYALADRQRDKLSATANVMPTDRLDLQFGAHYMRDKYPDTVAGIGMTEATNWIASFDATLQATDTLSGNFFASVDQYKTAQNGANISGATNTTLAQTSAGLASIPTYLGVTTLADRTLTLGVGMRYQPSRQYEVGATLLHSESIGRSSFLLGSAITTLDPSLPDLVSRLSRLELFGKYVVKKDLTINVKYAHERYRSADWAYGPSTLGWVSTVAGTTEFSPTYNVNFVGVSLVQKF